MSCESKCANKHECTCYNDKCKNFGKCCDCVAYHKKRGDLPTCLRKTDE